MSMKYIDTSSNDWSSILKIQDQYSRQQDLRRKQQQKLHQKLYKQQLQSLIQQQKDKRKNNSVQQRKLIQYATQKQNIIANKQFQQQQKWQKMRQNFSLDNYHSSLNKKIKQKQDINEQKKRFSQRFKKLSTQMSQQKEHQKRSYSLKQYQLALAYDQQLSEQHRRRLLSRDQQIKFQSLAARIEAQKQKQRLNNLNKIRFGYGQSQQIFKIVNEAHQKVQNQRNNFISQIANSHKDLGSIAQQQQELQHQKQRLRKQVSTYNRQQFEQKNFKKKINLIEQTLQQKQKFSYLNDILQEQKRQKSIQKEKQKKQLQSELQRQIREFQHNKMKTHYMNPQQFKINSSLLKKDKILSGSLLPGVGYDRQLQKQQKLMQRFLGGGSRQYSRISSSSYRSQK